MPIAPVNSSLKRIVIGLFIAIVAFISFMAYSINTSIKNTERLDGIKNSDFPVLERVDANIVRLDKIKELFLQALMSAEVDLIDDTLPIKESVLLAFYEIEALNPRSKKQVDLLIQGFTEYYDQGSSTTVFLMDRMDDMEMVKSKTDTMNDLLGVLQTRIRDFRTASYNSFTNTLTESNQSALMNMYMGIAVGVMNLFFMAILVYFIRNNFTMMAVIAEQNANLEHRVNERTAQLAQKTNDMNAMLNNMHLGVFTISSDKTIHPEYSAHLNVILEGRNIAGETLESCILDYSTLGSNAKDQVKASLESIIGEDSLGFSFNSHLLVNELVLNSKDGDPKILKLEWNPITSDDDTTDKLLVIVEDVTALKILEAEADKQKTELAIISQILKISIAKFNEFVESSLAFIEENKVLISKTKTKDPDVINLLFRNMHTIKGNARTYEFSNLTDIIHDVEQVYDCLRKEADFEWSQEGLLSDLESAKAGIAAYQNVNNHVLGRKGRASDLLTVRGCFISNEQIDELKADLTNITRSIESSDALSSLSTHILKIGQIPLARLIDGACDSISSLAQELGKPTPRVNIDDRGITLENAICEPLKSSFMHIVRNSIDHGIETSEDRLRKGKAEAGTITFKIVDGEDSVDLLIFDDGRGLALHKIYEKALANGLYKDGSKPSNHEIAQLIFHAGLSTAASVTQVSGRGVGLDAVKSFLSNKGINIAIELDSSASEMSFTAFKFVISIPKTLYSF